MYESKDKYIGFLYISEFLLSPSYKNFSFRYIQFLLYTHLGVESPRSPLVVQPVMPTLHQVRRAGRFAQVSARRGVAGLVQRPRHDSEMYIDSVQRSWGRCLSVRLARPCRRMYVLTNDAPGLWLEGSQGM